MTSVLLWAGFCACALAACSNSSGFKPPVAQKPLDATISGRIFLITAGGDLKPARMAHVYIVVDAQQTSVSKQALPLTKALQRDCDDVQFALHNDSQVIRAWVFSKFQKDFSSLDGFFKVSAVVASEADEDGRFKSNHLPPGLYTVIAVGQAGVNYGYWADSVMAGAGQQAEIKLSVPVQVCPVLM